MTYAERIIEQVKAKNAEQPEFIQAATEILGTLQPALDAHPEFEEAALLERIIEPERIIQFRVPWVDDSGKVKSTAASAWSTTPPSAPTRAACASTPPSRSAC